MKKTDLTGMMILLVEDDVFNQRFMKRKLENLNANVFIAEDGKEAIESESLFKADLILMDLYLPNMNGFEAIRQIRNTHKLATPIIALSGSVDEEDRKRVAELGANDYLIKPCNQALLEERIALLLKLPEQEEKGGNQEEIDSGLPPVFNLSQLKEISRGNKAFQEKMIRVFIEETEQSLTLLQQHIGQENYGSLSAVAHKMKSSIGMMGMLEVRANLQQIEHDAKSEQQLEDIPAKVEQVAKDCEIALYQLKQLNS